MYNLSTAYLLWFLSCFGVLGFHRFYLGKPATGVLWLVTGGLGSIGAIYDFFTLPGQVREANIREGMRRALDMDARPSVGSRFRDYEDQDPGTRRKESLQRTILRTAKKNRGIATPSEVALEADVSLEEAKAALEKLVTKGFAELRVRKSGAIVYSFPEFADDTDLEDF